MSTELKQFDFSPPEKKPVPLYKYREISPDSSFTYALASTTQGSFQLPANVVQNHSMSFIEWSEAYPELDAKYLTTHWGKIPLQAVALTTSRGVRLCDRNNIPIQSRVLLPCTTTREEWSKKEAPVFATTRTNGFAKSDALAAGNGSYQISHAGAQLTPSKNYWAPTAYLSGAVGDAGGAGNVTIIRRVYLSDIRHSWFSNMRRDFYPAEKLELRVTLPPANSLAFTADNANLNTPVTLQAAQLPVITGMKLYLAIQNNPFIAEEIRAKCMSGHAEVYQDTVEFKTSTPDTETSYAKTCAVNASHGIQLLRAYHTFQITDDGKTLADNINNVANAKWSLIRGYRDAQPESDGDLSPAQSFTYNQHVFDNSIITDELFFQNFATHVQDYSGCGAELGTNKVDAGLSLAQPIELAVQATKVGFTGVHWAWIVVNRQVNFSDAGISSSH